MSDRIVSTRTAFEGWIKVIIAEVATSGAKTFERVIESHGAAVAVLPYDPDRKVAIVISQFRAPIEYLFPGADNILEPVAGINDEADAQQCARREAMEEAGLHLNVLEPVARRARSREGMIGAIASPPV